MESMEIYGSLRLKSPWSFQKAVWWEFFHRKPLYFMVKNHGFRWRFSLTSQSIEYCFAILVCDNATGFWSGGNDVGLWQRQVSDPIFCSEFSTSRNDSKKILNWFSHTLGKYPHLIWLVVSTPLKNMKVSWDYNIPNIWEFIKFMFQTNHQPVMMTLLSKTSALTWIMHH
jgi:hypothetical protein